MHLIYHKGHDYRKGKGNSHAVQIDYKRVFYCIFKLKRIKELKEVFVPWISPLTCRNAKSRLVILEGNDHPIHGFVCKADHEYYSGQQ